MSSNLITLNIHTLCKMKCNFYKTLMLALLYSFLLSCSAKTQVVGDLMIKGGTVINGSGSPSLETDIVVKNDEIIWMGNSSEVAAIIDTVIVASGKIVTPGFIDLHAHGDPLKTPDFSNFLAMGVTTIALGMDGSSETSANIKSWMNEIRQTEIGVNILPFIGHGTVRIESEIGMSTNPDEQSIRQMTKLVDTALQLGCWGLSMGLEYMPGYYADSTELNALAEIVGKHEGLITSHIRNEDNDQIENSLDEMLQLSKHCKINISHLKVVYGSGDQRAQEILRILEKSQYGEHPISADLYPYNASYTGIGIVFPKWAKNPKKYKQIREQRGDELLEFLRNKIAQRNGPEATLFGTGPYAGKTLSDLVTEYNRPYEIILRDIIGPYGASAAYFVMNDELQAALVASPRVMIGSDGSPTMRHPRGYGTFAKIIEEFVLKDSILTIEEAIYKMTGQPAQTVGLKNRGRLAIGAKADILIFDPKSIRANATFENPHSLASGMDIVLVNGELSWQRNQLHGQHGLLLSKKAVD